MDLVSIVVTSYNLVAVWCVQSLLSGCTEDITQLYRISTALDARL